MEYNWTENDIKIRVERLQQLYDQTADEEEKKIIESQINFAKRAFRHIHTTYRQPSALEAYGDIKKWNLKCRFVWDPILTFLENSVGDYQTGGFSKMKLSDEDIMQLTHDFYKTLPKEFYEQYLKDYVQRKDHIRFRSSNNGHYYLGFSWYFPSLGENFAEIIRTRTISDVFTSIHENGHFLWARYNPKVYIANGYIHEVIPYTMELLASEYLANILGKDAPSCTGLYHKGKLKQARTWKEFYDILKAEEDIGEIKSKQDLLKAAELAGVKTSRLPSLLNLEANDNEHIIMGYIYAMELYTLYKKDPEYATKIMQKMMMDDTVEFGDSIKMLEDLGLHANEHSKEFHEGMILTFKQD